MSCNEFDQYKNSSRFRIKLAIFTLKVLKFLNGDVFTFIFSFLTVFGPLFLLGHESVLLIGLLFHFILWKYLKPFLDKLFKNDEEIKCLNDGIEALQKLL